MDIIKNLRPYQLLFLIAPIFALLLWNVETHIEFVNSVIKWDRGWIGIRLSLFVGFNAFIYWIFRDVMSESASTKFHIKLILGSCIATTLLMLYSHYFNVEISPGLNKVVVLIIFAFLLSTMVLIMNFVMSFAQYYFKR